MLKRLPLFLVILPFKLVGQQFIGSSNNVFPNVRQIAINPAYTASALDGTEVHLFSFSALAGTNAYRFSKEFASGNFSGNGLEGVDYFRDTRGANKHVWGNVDIMGPAVSFKVNESVAIGGYMRLRSIFRGGNLSPEGFSFIGKRDPETTIKSAKFTGAGYTTHTFSEIGFSYGRLLGNDFYHVFRGGFNIKYLMGMSAGTIYSDNAVIHAGSAPGVIDSLKGDVHVAFTPGIKKFVNGDVMGQTAAWFQKNGRGGLGVDLGFQYEYHPDGNPNIRTPYKLSLAVSITDIGSIRYPADTGSATYKMQLEDISGSRLVAAAETPYWQYFGRQTEDSMVLKEREITSFSVGLPTAFRVNLDWNMGGNLYLQTHLMFNLRGNGDGLYNPGYVSMLNFTPRYQHSVFSVALPFTFIGYQMLTVGAAIHLGPFYMGSSSLISTIMAKQINSLDGYAGIVIPLQKQANRY